MTKEPSIEICHLVCGTYGDIEANYPEKFSEEWALAEINTALAEEKYPPLASVEDMLRCIKRSIAAQKGLRFGSRLR